jgi:nicotinate phosphoribosyltransferase
LSTDLYQLTMAAGYLRRGMARHLATCELFVRRLPATRRYLVALGVDQVAEHATRLRFTPEDVAFLAQVPALRAAMTPEVRDYLLSFRFSGDLWAVDEGAIVFEHEPILRVRAPIIEAQILETFALSVVNHATMIGSKAARIVRAARGRTVVEFGTRRTHADAAVDAARAAYAVGFAGTSNVLAARTYGIPVLGTAAHMWTMAHPSEQAAFEAYVAVFPESAILLVDTFDTLRGAVRAARAAGDRLRGVRIDSGDLDALSREVRRILDAEGAPHAKIVVSGDLNEHSIAALPAAGAPIDTFGVGTELVCSADAPALGGVYKLGASATRGPARWGFGATGAEASPLTKKATSLSERNSVAGRRGKVCRSFPPRSARSRDRDPRRSAINAAPSAFQYRRAEGARERRGETSELRVRVPPGSERAHHGRTPPRPAARYGRGAALAHPVDRLGSEARARWLGPSWLEAPRRGVLADARVRPRRCPRRTAHRPPRVGGSLRCNLGMRAADARDRSRALDPPHRPLAIDLEGRP